MSFWKKLGKVLSGEETYRCSRRIESDPVSEVHKARQRKTRDLVALKRILMHNEKDGVCLCSLDADPSCLTE